MCCKNNSKFATDIQLGKLQPPSCVVFSACVIQVEIGLSLINNAAGSAAPRAPTITPTVITLVRDYTCNTRRQGRIVDIIAPVTGLETDAIMRSTSVTGVD